MKAIPKEHLLLLIEQYSDDLILKTDIDKLFEQYGDDFYKDSSWGSFELTNINKDRITKVKAFKAKDNEGNKGSLPKI